MSSDEDDVQKSLKSPEDAEDVTGKRGKNKKSKKEKKSSKQRTTDGQSSSSRLKEILQGYLDRLPSRSNSPRAMKLQLAMLVLGTLLVVLVFASSVMDLGLQDLEEPTQVMAVVEPEEIIVQHLPGKKSARMNAVIEKDFGCKEIQCVAQCNSKAKPKCLKSRSCVAERDKICQKRCRATRCEDRCKDEPHLGYVEREQGLEKCKEECTGPTASHNKCVMKCHTKYKPCKTRCKEMASKFKCDNLKILALVAPGGGAASSSDGDDEEEEESTEKRGKSLKGDDDGEDEEEEGGDAPPPPPKLSSSSSKKSSSSAASMPGLDDDDLL